MAGRKPLPTAIKAARGNPGKRPLNKSEPQAPPGMPPCPEWLPAEAREVWAELAPQLEGMRVVTHADRLALTLLCAAMSEWRDARNTVEREGTTYTSQTVAGGQIMRPHPAVAIRDDAWRRVKAALVEFGLTPSSRSRLHAGPEPPEDPVDDLLDRGKAMRKRALRLVPPRRPAGGEDGEDNGAAVLDGREKDS